MAKIRQELEEYFKLCDEVGEMYKRAKEIGVQAEAKAKRIWASLEKTPDEKRFDPVVVERRVGDARYRFHCAVIEVLPDDRIDPDKNV